MRDLLSPVLFGFLLGSSFFNAVGANPPGSPVTVKDGVIYCFTDRAADGVITHCQIEDKKLWVDAIRRGGKTRKMVVMNEGAPTPLKLFWPEVADGTITWNMPVQREGDIVSVTVPPGVLMGDLMDVNEGKAESEALRKKLGIASGADNKLPVLYLSGDSIACYYWPYLVKALHNEVNVYFQWELAKDMPGVDVNNNGHAQVAYIALTTAYANTNFSPDYLLVNCGLHMIAAGKSAAEYGQWIERFDDLAKQHHARLIWVMTTPYGESFRPDGNKAIIQFNDMARTIATRRNIPVVDLHADMLTAVTELGETNVYSDGVHFRDDVRMRQAAFIAARVREIVASRQASRP